MVIDDPAGSPSYASSQGNLFDESSSLKNRTNEVDAPMVLDGYLNCLSCVVHYLRQPS